MNQKSYVWTILIFVQVALTISQMMEAECENLCSCELKTLQYGRIAFRVICNGNQNQKLHLNDGIFLNESVPGQTRIVYVRLNNFSAVTIGESFLSRWIAYVSCSLDIWGCQNVMFPTTLIGPANTSALFFEFAGIGISNSSLNQFPPKIFKDRKNAGIKLSQSKMNLLNIADLGMKSINYIEIVESTVGTIKGNLESEINLKKTANHGMPRITFVDSHIGVIYKNSLNIKDFKESKGSKAKIIVRNSTIGYLEKESVILGSNVALNISSCYIGFLSASSIQKHESVTLEIENNIIRVQPDAMTHLACLDDQTSVSKNVLIPFQTSDDSNHTDILSEETFVHSTCKGNIIFSFSELATTKLIQPTTTMLESTTQHQVTQPSTIIFNSTTTTSQSPEEVMTDLSSVSTRKGKFGSKHIPMGLFYLVIGLCFALLVIIMVLIGFVVFGKFKKGRNRSQKIDDSSNIYEEPQYFAPNVPPSFKDLEVVSFTNRPETNHDNVYTNKRQSSNLQIEDVYVQMN